MDFTRLLTRFFLLSLLPFALAAAADGNARLRVTQHETLCCYAEGSVSFLEIRDSTGAVVALRQFRAEGMIHPGVDQRLAPEAL